MTSRIPSRRRPISFPGGGEMGRLIAGRDWSQSPLGPMAGWSAALCSAVGLILPAGAEIILFWGPDYVALYNDAYIPLIGNKHPGGLGARGRENWSELWDDLEPLLRNIRETGESFTDKNRVFMSDRHGYPEETFFDIAYSAVRDDDGSVGGVMCIVAETTDRMRARQQIVAENARLAQMFDQAPGFMALVRAPGYVVELANAAYLDVIGKRHAVGRRIVDFLPEAEAQGFIALLDEVIATGRPHRGTGVPLELRDDHGAALDTRFVDFILQPIVNADGKVDLVFIEGSDVTDRVRAGQRLVVSEESLRLAIDAAGVGTWDLDLATDELFWSERTKAVFGISPDVPCSMEDFYAGLHPDDLAATRAAFAAALDPDRREFYDIDYRAIGAEDGVVRWVSAKGRGVFEGDVCVRAIGTVIDISDRREAERALRDSELRFRTLADAAPALMWICDADANVTFVNRWYGEIFGRSGGDGLGDSWRSIVHPDDVDGFFADFRTAIADRSSLHRDVRMIDRDGRILWLRCEGRPRYVNGAFHGFVGCNVEVTDVHLAAEALERGIVDRTRDLASANAALTDQIAERERVEATLHQMQRLEAVGQLTSGVAHDFNNLLTIVLGNIDMIARAARDGALDAKTLRRVDHVRTAAERGAALTAQLLAFSRRQRLEAKAIDLNATVHRMQGLMESALGNAVTIGIRLADDLWPALVDPTQIELIILNLAINARDAMTVGGTLIVETANVTRGEPDRPEHPPAGDHVMVAVADTGTGMTEEVLAKAFEPFFTTKDIGKGSGLGLAQVFGFAKQSGGGVAIETCPGKGTTVRVYLPRTNAVIASEAAPQCDASAGRTVADCRVLIVDDDDAVRAITVETLTEMGCVVVEAIGGEAAVRIVENDPTIELALIDFAMPGMNGAEVARRVRAVRPGMKLLYVTGFAELTAIADVPEDMIVQKPFHATDLQSRVRRALDR